MGLLDTTFQGYERYQVGFIIAVPFLINGYRYKKPGSIAQKHKMIWKLLSKNSNLLIKYVFMTCQIKSCKKKMPHAVGSTILECPSSPHVELVKKLKHQKKECLHAFVPKSMEKVAGLLLRQLSWKA